MQLPPTLKMAIESLLDSCDIHQLIEAREELTKRYRDFKTSQFMKTNIERLSYLISRMPATYGALTSAFKAINEREIVPVHSLLDLGAGPGTGMWAASSFFPDIEKVTLIEKDSALSSIGRRLAVAHEYPAFRSANWQEADLEHLTNLPPHDLVMLSYSVGELKREKIPVLIDQCWDSTNQILVVVEPGTPAGFERIRLIRQQLIEKGAHLIAPCPHHLSCPMTSGDWCHFSARIERTSLHRRLKGGSLGYEDEKFSYVAAMKTPVCLPEARILRDPVRHSGHVSLKLCTPEGVKETIISKKSGNLYKQARKADWGDSFCTT